MHCITGFLTTWSLTDTSAARTFGVYDEKTIHTEIWRKKSSREWYKYRGNTRKFPMLSYEEDVQRLRSKAAEGMKHPEDCNWAMDPEVKAKVFEEIECRASPT